MLKSLIWKKRKEDLDIDLNEESTSTELKYNFVLNKIYSGFEILKNLRNISDEMVYQFRNLYEKSSYYSICQVNLSSYSFQKK